MRRLPALAATALLAALALGCSQGSDAGSAEGVAPRPAPGATARLSTHDGSIVDEGGNRVLLRGMNAFAELEAGEGVPAEEFERMADAGFNVVRLATYWDVLEPRPPAGGRHEYATEQLEALDRTIERAGDAGLYVVLTPVLLFNMSPAFGGRGIPAWVYQQRGYDRRRAEHGVATDRYMHENLNALLMMLAERYGDDPVVAAFDPVNEPPAAPQDAILDWYRDMADVLRREAPDTMVMVEPRFGDHDMTKADLERLGNRDNLVLSPHFYYGGGAGAGYAEDGSKAGKYLFDGKTDYTGGTAEDLREHLERSTKAAAEAGMPVWVGEFGIGRELPGARRYVEDLTRVMAQEGVGWAYWVHRSEDAFSATDGSGRYAPLVEVLSRAAKRAGD